MYWMTLTQGEVTAVALISKKFACLHDKVTTTNPITTKRGRFIALVMVITWLQEWDGGLTWTKERKGCESSIHDHDID